MSANATDELQVFLPGTLVAVRGRDWVVLPESSGKLLRLRPLGGIDEEATAVHLDLESVSSSRFQPPTAENPGDHRSCRLLRDAARLSFRSGAGPFRSFGRLNFEPRPYQLVPLLLALRQPFVRLLIADDVGIGKTIEAGLIVRELLDRDEIAGFSVVCLPHLVGQWHEELRDKFHLDAEIVTPGTANRLERGCRVGESLFNRHSRTVVSLDFVKSDRWRPLFLQARPKCVVIDEAHVCAGTGTDSRHQRKQFLREIAKLEETHLILTTATPHSGNENAFRELLYNLNPDFSNLPNDLRGEANEPLRREVARHLVQRRRADIKLYASAATVFPERLEKEETYALSAAGSALLHKLLRYARETVRDPGLDKLRRRVRWWSALALLRGLSSSPAAAAETLRRRAALLDCPDEETLDRLGGSDLLDGDGGEDAVADVMPGADIAEIMPETDSARRRLKVFAREAEALAGPDDPKLRALQTILTDLFRKKARPIIFCRFIPTVRYVAEHIRTLFPKQEVTAITGEMAPEERKDRIAKLMEGKYPLLVCTDCLSEGINLQQGFDAVVHYDLSWNPTRHEQREGRVDRYGQKSPAVKTVILYGANNPVDGMVLKVLIQKHRNIRSSLGVSVPVPVDTDKIVEALFESLLFAEERNRGDSGQGSIFDESQLIPVADKMVREWQAAGEREKRSQTFYAQHSVKPEEVEAELDRARSAVGDRVVLESFIENALKDHGAGVSSQNGIWTANLSNCPQSLREALDINENPLVYAFPGQEGRGAEILTRTHPKAENLAAWVLNSALDPLAAECLVRRSGVVRTAAVETHIALLLLRLRFQLLRRGKRLLAEECLTLGFAGKPSAPQWLDEEGVRALLDAKPAGNIPADLVRNWLGKTLDSLEQLKPELERLVRERGKELLASHNRVRRVWSREGRREAAHAAIGAERVEPSLPPDILGVFVYLPLPNTGG
ncbi:MAG: DEAD/DEAH box helicase [Planctomycetota bacterium]|jgi:superfamily II DNA or RNA helicase|nr:DEAD/DEAH box helicase [Planctomycetota bacterium]